jgi:predicted lipid-binding transport protein (Tim44 family)
MNRTGRRSSKYFSIAMLAGAFVMSSEMPLLASPPQSSQSSTSTASQKPDDSLPDAPQPQSQTPPSQQPATTPSGAAGAKAAKVKGAPVAKPAGAAVAPARQRGHRSLLIKLGLVAGAGIAVGSAVALAERSPSRPPSASSAGRQ